MTSKANKQEHKKIIEVNSVPLSPEENNELVFGDKFNPNEKFNNGDKDLNFSNK